MRTTNQLTNQKEETNLFARLENARLLSSEMLLVKGGDADGDVNHGGSDDQEDGFN